MARKTDRQLIVGLDIGTSKVVALVGEIAEDGSIELIGIGTQPSRGLKRGMVVDIESTTQSIQRAVEEAELMAGCEIHSVYAGIAGSHIRSLNSHGVVAIRDKEVGQADIEHVVDAVLPTAEQAQRLQMDAAEPCLLLTRRTWTQGVPVTLVRCLHPASRYRLGSRYSASGNAIST